MFKQKTKLTMWMATSTFVVLMLSEMVLGFAFAIPRTALTAVYGDTQVAQRINNGASPYADSGKYYKLTDNIDLSAYSNGKGWAAGISGSKPFKDIFYSEGHGIDGLQINRRGGNNIGMFGYVVGGTLKNIAVEGTNIVGNNYAGTNEIVLLILGGIIVLAFVGYVVFLIAVKKKTLIDFGRAIKKIFLREKTVTVEIIKEVPVRVPVFNGQPLPDEEFTPREKEVVKLLLLCKSRREIAEALCISEHTAKAHTKNILDKCEVGNQKAFISKYVLGEKNSSETDDSDI